MKNEESLINVLLVEDEETLALIIKDTKGKASASAWRKTEKKGSGGSSKKSPTCWWRT